MGLVRKAAYIPQYSVVQVGWVGLAGFGMSLGLVRLGAACLMAWLGPAWFGLSLGLVRRGLGRSGMSLVLVRHGPVRLLVRLGLVWTVSWLGPARCGLSLGLAKPRDTPIRTDAFPSGPGLAWCGVVGRMVGSGMAWRGPSLGLDREGSVRLLAWFETVRFGVSLGMVWQSIVYLLAWTGMVRFGSSLGLVQHGLGQHGLSLGTE